MQSIYPVHVLPNVMVEALQNVNPIIAWLVDFYDFGAKSVENCVLQFTVFLTS